MAEWELGEVLCSVRVKTPPGSWHTAPTGLEILATTIYQVRFGFTVVNGEGPIETGDMYVQHSVDDGPFVDWVGDGKDMAAGYDIFAPEYAYEDLNFTLYDDSLVRVRMRLDWVTEGFSESVNFTVGTWERILATVPGGTAKATLPGGTRKATLEGGTRQATLDGGGTAIATLEGGTRQATRRRRG